MPNSSSTKYEGAWARAQIFGLPCKGEKTWHGQGGLHANEQARTIRRLSDYICSAWERRTTTNDDDDPPSPDACMKETDGCAANR